MKKFLLIFLLLISCQKEFEPQTYQVYFSSSRVALDPNSCDKVFPVDRLLLEEADAEEKLEIAIAELLQGPTFFEKSDRGYSSFFSKESKDYLIDAKIEDGIAYINFKDFRELIPNASSSCGSSQLLAQLGNTALQFEEVERAIYAFNGSTKDFYEWLQMSAPEESFIN